MRHKPSSIAAPERLTDALLARGMVSEEAVRRAVARQRTGGGYLGEILVAQGVLDPGSLRAVLSELLDVPAVDLRVAEGDPLVLELIPKARAFELQALALFKVENELTVAMADPDNLRKLDELSFLTGHKILPVLALSTEIMSRLAELYGDFDPDEDDDSVRFETPSGEVIDDTHDVEEISIESPLVRLVNLVIARAIQQEASDIHFEPQEGKMLVRYRIDGRLQLKSYRIPANAAPAMLSRIKILAQCDISEKRVPQDGKVRVRYRNRRVDARVSTFPTLFGEKIVMRLLDKDRQLFTIDTIAMSEEVLDRWKGLLRRREGIILVTGPTGSGKSSTLYATLRHISRPEVNIVTLEDPVEYELAGIAQGQVNERAGFTFASGLRSILRQDPDIILVGEIRDAETARIAVQAALTGHLVLSTLHTNNAPSTVTRLVDIGVPRYLVAASLLGVLAQRLVRRVCPECVGPAEPSAEEAAYLRPWLDRGVPFTEGVGCQSCSGAGYRGRVGVHELLVVGDAVESRIAKGEDEASIASEGANSGYRRLWWDGLEKVRQGVTTLRELASSIAPDDSSELNRAPTSGPDTRRTPG